MCFRPYRAALVLLPAPALLPDLLCGCCCRLADHVVAAAAAAGLVAAGDGAAARHACHGCGGRAQARGSLPSCPCAAVNLPPALNTASATASSAWLASAVRAGLLGAVAARRLTSATGRPRPRPRPRSGGGVSRGAGPAARRGGGGAGGGGRARAAAGARGGGGFGQRLRPGCGALRYHGPAYWESNQP